MPLTCSEGAVYAFNLQQINEGMNSKEESRAFTRNANRESCRMLHSLSRQLGSIQRAFVDCDARRRHLCHKRQTKIDEVIVTQDRNPMYKPKFCRSHCDSRSESNV
jgi:hypothetical protein